MTSYLITTTDRSRWPNSGHLVFMGTFCLPDHPESLLGQYTYEIANTAVTPDDKLHYFRISETAHEHLSIQLVKVFNQVHNLNRSQKYWAICTGSWLRLFIDLLISRIFVLAGVRADHDDLQIVSADELEVRRTPFNAADFHALTKSADWNSLVYLDLWRMADIQPIQIAHVPTSLPHEEQSSNPINHSGFVLSATYLPRVREILLQLRLGTLPRRLHIIAAPAVASNEQLRSYLKFSDAMTSTSVTGSFETLLETLLRRYIPTSFLEGFGKLTESVSHMRFPQNPKAIFTSNRHLYDDVFNVWAAEATETGSRLILGQHGGHFGVSRFPSFAERHECAVSDSYLTWGWKPSSLTVGGIILTTIGSRWKPQKIRTKALLVTDELWSQPRAVYVDINENSDYLEHVGLLVRSLPSSIQSSLEIRRHLGQNVVGHPVDDWWKNQLPTIDLGNTSIPFSQLVKSANIVIIAHNGTTIPENFSRGIPTLITWTSNWVEIRDEAKPIFARLAAVGIFHDDPVALANHLESIWDNVDAWWESADVVEARELFCSQYARSVSQPLKFLRKIIVGKLPTNQRGDL